MYLKSLYSIIGLASFSSFLQGEILPVLTSLYEMNQKKQAPSIAKLGERFG